MFSNTPKGNSRNINNAQTGPSICDGLTGSDGLAGHDAPGDCLDAAHERLHEAATVRHRVCAVLTGGHAKPAAGLVTYRRMMWQ